AQVSRCSGWGFLSPSILPRVREAVNRIAGANRVLGTFAQILKVNASSRRYGMGMKRSRRVRTERERPGMGRHCLLVLTLVCLPAPSFAQTPGRPASTANYPLPVISNGRSRQPEPALPEENLRTFQPEALWVNWAPSGWQLKAGEVLLKDFGRN